MFVKYPKTYRILVPQINIKGKHFLSGAEVKKLLGGRVVITEKMDGANVGIIRHKNYFKLQKRGSLVDVSEHEQFNVFKAWSNTNYDKIMQIPKDTILYGEFMYAKHTVHYDMLPDYFLAFAWWDNNLKEFASWEDLEILCNNIGINTVPLVAITNNANKDELFEDIPDPSIFGHEPAEGIVVWNHKANLRGKIVRSQFQKAMNKSGHWASKPVTKNIVSDKCTCIKSESEE
jgi:ATP-dependent RNA circularization protein (DNA/RNA ligase family)